MSGKAGLLRLERRDLLLSSYGNSDLPLTTHFSDWTAQASGTPSPPDPRAPKPPKPPKPPKGH
jgi:hypothetical protein